MMSLDEAIKHCDEVAEELEKEAVKGCCDDSEIMDKCIECADEHRQLAKWLRELKKLKEFACYVANSITTEKEEFDENPRFFGEVYCRKLHKLGIIKDVDNKWVYDGEVNADDDRQSY